jgi:peptide deformylase
VSIRRIVIYGDPVLRRKSDDITSFDDSLRALVADMYETNKSYNGVGLAANQVGVAQRVFIVDVPVAENTRERFAVINPVLDQREGKESGEEGCLSMPGLYEEVMRATKLRLRGFDEFGKPLEKIVEGYLARAVQHETDHLDGVLFTDRLGPLKKQFLRRQLDELARGEIPEGYHPEDHARGNF